MKTNAKIVASSFSLLVVAVVVSLFMMALSMSLSLRTRRVQQEQEVQESASSSAFVKRYRIANSETFDTSYKEKEYFDVYSLPIRTLYSQVHWRDHPNIRLPEDIVERFSSSTKNNSKIMAVIGYEVDQVFTMGPNDHDEEYPVPLTWAYNHHYGAWLYNSQKVRLVEADHQDATTNSSMRMGSGLHHGATAPKRLVPKLLSSNELVDELDNNDGDEYPKTQWFSEGNGGEFRCSYHGYPKGYAQLIESPDTFHVVPMQIDTWNRNTTGTAFVPGAPLPSTSRIPFTAEAHATYSGLIECPCSDKLTKEWHMSYITTASTDSDTSSSNDDNKCTGGPIENATECFAAARQVLVADSVHEHDEDEESPSYGCSATLHDSGSMDVVWNNKNYNKNDYNSDSKAVAQVVGTALGVVNLTVNLLVSPPTSTPTGASNNDDNDVDAEKNSNNAGAANLPVARLQLVGPADRWLGVGFGSTSMCLHLESDECPTGGPYAIIVSPAAPPSPSSSSSSSTSSDGDGDLGDSDSGSSVIVTERKLGYHGPGFLLKSSVIVESNVVVDGVRTIHLVRSVQGITEDHYTFDATTPTLPVILATGCGGSSSSGTEQQLEQHCGHGFGTIQFLPVETPVTICRAGIVGMLGGNVFDSQNRCAPSPTSDLRDQRNPTCQIQTYAGGLSCCRDGESLLDAGQANPWPDQYLEYRLKFRFYFEEYRKQQPARNTIVMAPKETASKSTSQSSSSVTTAVNTPTTSAKATHQNLVRLYWQTEAFAGEYDIVQCEAGTPKSQCVQVITSKWKVRDFLQDCSLDDPSCTGKGSTNDSKTAGIKLIYAGPHCHASTCLSMELYNADTGKLLCRVEPIYGQTDQVYDERGFIAIPPCLWSDDPTAEEEEGLMKPELLTLNTTLLSIKRNNNTLPHTGEMASWQMRGIVVPKEQQQNDDDDRESSVAAEELPQQLASSTANRRFGVPDATMEEQRLTSRHSPLLRHVSSVDGAGNEGN